MDCEFASSCEDTDSEEEVSLEEVEPTYCLFCEEKFKCIDECITHLDATHCFNLAKLKCKFNMDQYSYIKLINYIRTNKVKPNVIYEAEEVLWNNEKYLKPVKYETWLTYDFEDLFEPLVKIKPLEVNSAVAKDEVIKQMAEDIAKKNMLLQQAREDMKMLRQGFKRIFEKGDFNDEKNAISYIKSETLDEGYFGSYAHFNIHYEMLTDSVRTEAYRDAFIQNKKFMNGKTVLDIGTGTSILSMFASLAGAKEVVGVDNSEIVYNAMEIVKKNNFKNITLIKGKIEDTSLPIDRFDVIVSEWMGYFLIFEGMLDSIIYGRDNFLKPGGTLMPNRCTISIVGYGDEKRYDDFIVFWDKAYGFDMSSIKSDVLREPCFEICKEEYILTEENIIAEYDLNTISLNYSNFEYDFNFKCKKSGTLTSFMGYFDTFFELPNPISFSTSASSKPTHWKQAIFYLDKKVKVNEGEIIAGKIVCRRSIKNLRSINVKIKVFGKEFNYYID